MTGASTIAEWAGLVLGTALKTSVFTFGSLTTIISQHCVLFQDGAHLTASINIWRASSGIGSDLNFRMLRLFLIASINSTRISAFLLLFILYLIICKAKGYLKAEMASRKNHLWTICRSYMRIGGNKMRKKVKGVGISWSRSRSLGGGSLRRQRRGVGCFNFNFFVE